MKNNPHLPGDRDTFINKNMGLVRYICNKYRNSVTVDGAVDYEDLFMEGCIGLIKAYDNYDPTKFERVTQFSTYAVPKIQGEIKKFLRDKLGALKFSREQRQDYDKIMGKS